jgi:hypothetical protein
LACLAVAFVQPVAAQATHLAPNQSSGNWTNDKDKIERPRGVVPRHGSNSAAPVTASASVNPNCKGCNPPLLFTRGNVVIGGITGIPGRVTITPFYWAPAGYSFAASYKSIINGYLQNVAADSGRPSNVFSVGTQYYQQSTSAGAPIQHIQYTIQAGAEINDSAPFPAQGGTSGCTAAAGFSACVADGALQAELRSRLTALGRPVDDSNLYIVMFPSGVETCQGPGSAAAGAKCSVNTYCAYHSGNTAGSYLVYANEPYPDITHCADPFNGPQAPNGDPYADAQVSLISHEANEAITNWAGAWQDSAGYENGDECAWVYGAPLGSTGVPTDPGARGTAYNQVIGTGKYYTQDEFSNEDYALGAGDQTVPGGTLVPGCRQREESPTASFTGPTSVGAGQAAAFNGSASTDPDNTGALVYAWSWGDGSANGSGVTPTHAFAAAGTYTITLTVTDVDGWSASITQGVSVTTGTATPPPTVAGVAPSSGPATGGTAVTISGSGFQATVSAVKFGAAAARFTVNTDSSITAYSPANIASLVDVSVTNVGGTSTASFATHYTFVGAAPCPTGMTGSPIRGDFSGNGKGDMALVTNSGVCLLQSTGSGFQTPVTWSSLPFYGTRDTVAGDVSGTGRTALIALNDTSTWIMTSTPTGFNAPAQGSGLPFYGTRGTFVADMNGDGKADLVAVNDSSVWVMLSNGAGFNAPAAWSSTPFYGNIATLVGDFNGDGKADLIAINSTSTWLMTSTGGGFNAPALWSNLPFYGQLTTAVGDVNGDGKADLVAINPTSIWVMTSTGGGFNGPALWSNVAFYGNKTTLVGDVNGDKRADVLAVNNNSLWVMTSSAAGFNPPSPWLY